MNSITIDIDENYDEWYNSNAFKTAVTKIRDKMRGVKAAWVRRSSSNHVHIKIDFDRDLSLFQSFCHRAFMDDDPHRLACDLDRFYRTEKLENTGRCFDQKYTKGKVKTAGVWMKII